MQKYDGIVLYSGGLDSILAYRILSEQGLHLLALKFTSVFFPLKITPLQYKKEQKERFGVDVEVREVTDEFLPVVRNPRFGYGRWMNPCLDCKLFMYRLGAGVMKENGAKFLATGEVLGQRPMTQHRGELRRLEKEAGLENLVVRPLSGKLLPKTEAEESGLLDRGKFLSISGRGRREQMHLARQMGITGYPTPAGGCYLTDETFARRLKDMFVHGSDKRALPLLLTGRHFRISESCRLIAGRNHQENLVIEESGPEADALLVPVSHVGPSAIMHGTCTDAQLALAAGIVARYGDAPPGEKTAVRITDSKGQKLLSVDALDEIAIEQARI